MIDIRVAHDSINAVKRLTHALRQIDFFHWFFIIFSSLEIWMFLHVDSHSKYAKQSTSNTFILVHMHDGKVIMEVRKNAHAIRSLSLLFVQIFYSFS